MELIKSDFKKYLLSKDEVRKKNYIGDAIIAERSETDEIEEQTEEQK